MKRHTTKTQSFICLLLVQVLLIGSLITPIFSQDRPIVISFGQPNIWSLEQAHYLLARMHRQNLDLRTASLGDLDPNAINATRIEILRTMLSLGISFDDAIRVNNRLLRDNKNFNSKRRQQLLNERDSLQRQSNQLAREIAELQIEKANAKSDEERDKLDGIIQAKTGLKAEYDNRISAINTELSDVSSPSGDFQSVTAPDGFDPDKLPKSVLDELIKNAGSTSSIAASMKLQNHIDMQYEIIAKQLTLLRDEVGPGERLVFLELPQSFNTSQDRAENKVAQVWWRIAGYTTVDREKLFEKELGEVEGKVNYLLTNINEKVESIKINCTQRIGLNDYLRTLKNQLEELCKEKPDEVCKQSLSAKQKERAITETRESIQLLHDQEFKLKKEQAKLIQTIAPLRTKLEKLKAEKTKREVRKQQDKMNRLLQGGSSSTSEVVKQVTELMTKSRGFGKAIYDDSPFFRVSDFIDPEGLVIKLRNQQDEVSRYLYSKFSSDIQKALDNSNPSSVELLNILIDALNRLLTNATLDTNRFPKGSLTKETQDLIAQKPQGSDMIRLNRLILENAYPNEIAKSQKTYTKDDIRTYWNLEDAKRDFQGKPLLSERPIRTIDIIPRQNALNVNDKKERVKATGTVAAFSFLFGFGGKFSYQRQSENFDEFVQQELYTSGFGKGDKDFGWSFYPFPGTKQVAPGVRTTYAVAIIPEDAETIALKAKGCYFDRKDYQLNNYDDNTKDHKFRNPNNSREASCSEEQAYVIPVPGGSSDGADFWVTKLWYGANRQPNERLVASIYGQNFSSQLGVLVDGVPLAQSVGLAQPSVESLITDQLGKDLLTANPNCGNNTICGRFERIDSEQIVVSFNMPKDYQGTPTITLIAPGTAIDINKLDLNINGVDDTKLDDAAWMFGSPPQEAARTIKDFKVYPSPTVDDPHKMRGVITGSGFKPTSDRFFVNGQKATPTPTSTPTSTPTPTPTPTYTSTYTSTNCRSDFCVVTFSDPNTETFTVTIVPSDDKEKSVSKAFDNPNTLRITGTSVVKLEVDKEQKPVVMVVRIDGSGFSKNGIDIVVDGCRNPETLIVESGQLILKLPNPEAAVRVTLTDKITKHSVSAVVTQPSTKTVVLKPSKE